MESNQPDPDLRQESACKDVAESRLYRRGLTPRNVSPQKRSRNIQPNQSPNDAVIEYVDDTRQSYATIVDSKLGELKLRQGSKRFIDINVCSDSMNNLLCAKCVREKIDAGEDDLMEQFRKFVMKNEDGEDCSALIKKIDMFEKKRLSNKKRRTATIEKKCEVRLVDDVLGLSSNISLQCQNCMTHCYPMNKHRKSGKGHQKTTDATENVMAILLPFITGTGPTELETILNFFGLPNSKHYKKSIARWQTTVAEEIIKISEREMRYAMAEEIKATTIADSGEKYYETWIKQPIQEREKVGLVVSYDMGWQKRASGNSYSSKSGHAFVVGMQTRQIIDCIVFSTNCKRCEYKPRKKKRTKKDEKRGGELTEDEDEIDEAAEDETILWQSSLPVQRSSLADEGFVARDNTDQASKEIEPVPTNTGNDNSLTTSVARCAISTTQQQEDCTIFSTLQRASTNAPVITVTPNTDGDKSKATPDPCSRFICQPVKTAKVLFRPTYQRSIHPLEKEQNVSQEQMATNVLEPSINHDCCPCNYDGSPGSMESDGMLLLMKRLHTMMSGSVYYEYIVSDDDTTMKKYLTHPAKRPRGEVNIGGRLPREIPAPKWFADPTHRAKCVAGKFFNYNKTEKKMSKLDCLRLKKYYSYYIKCNRNKSVEGMMENIMAPLDHLFDDHRHCESSWCHKKAEEEKKTECKDGKSEQNRAGHYRCTIEDKELYETLCDLYKPYITKDRIEQCRHEFETQVNEGMNTCVAKYAPKGRHYSKSVSLEARVKVAAGIYNVGYHFFWTEVLKGLDVDIEPSIEEYLLQKDKDKLRKYNRDHNHVNMAKRKRKEHEQLRKELDLRYKNIAKNMEYSPMVGCNAMIGDKGDKKKKSGRARVCGDTRGKTVRRECKHRLYGCTGGRNTKTYHSSERSQYCTFSGKSKEEIEEIREAYFQEHPDARKEYESTHPDGGRKRKGNKTGEKGTCELVCTRCLIQ